MKNNFSHFKWVLYAPKKATEICNFMNEQRDGGFMYAPNVIKKNKYSRVEVFDEEGYSVGYLC